MGTYAHKSDVEVRLRQIEAFKHAGFSPKHGGASHEGGVYEVKASTGRVMGRYATREEAERRVAQLEAQAAQIMRHSWPGQPRLHSKAAKKGHRHHERRYSHSPKVVRLKHGWRVRAKTGRNLGTYPTKGEALNRVAQIEANAVKFFTKTRGYTMPQHSPSRRRAVPNRADLIAALGLEPEGTKRGQKYDFTTAEFWHKVRTHSSPAAVRARRVFGLPEPRRAR